MRKAVAWGIVGAVAGLAGVTLGINFLIGWAMDFGECPRWGWCGSYELLGTIGLLLIIGSVVAFRRMKEAIEDRRLEQRTAQQ